MAPWPPPGYAYDMLLHFCDTLLYLIYVDFHTFFIHSQRETGCDPASPAQLC